MNPLKALILECTDQIVIKQHFSVTEAVTGIDKRNRYQIWDGRTGNQMFTAEEGEIGCFTRGSRNRLETFFVEEDNHTQAPRWASNHDHST